jgi:hypothetical protein
VSHEREKELDRRNAWHVSTIVCLVINYSLTLFFMGKWRFKAQFSGGLRNADVKMGGRPERSARDVVRCVTYSKNVNRIYEGE